jgi:hypothetical protein
MASPAFRRRQEDLGRMAAELMTLLEVGKITPTVAEETTLEAIAKALGTTGRGARPRQNCCQSAKLIRGQRRTQGPRPGDYCRGQSSTCGRILLPPK